MPFLRFLAALGAVLALTAGPARADDPAAVLAKIRSATAAVTSFVILVQATNMPGVGGSITIVLPASMKSAFTFGPTSIESYALDGMVYVHVPDGGWQKMKADPADIPAQYLTILDSWKSPNVTLLPDRKRNHAIVGVFATEAMIPQAGVPFAQPAPQTCVCTYDKASYLAQTCSTAGVAYTFTKYNDPSNTVVLPDEAKTAVLVIHRPAPSAAPTATDPPSAPRATDPPSAPRATDPPSASPAATTPEHGPAPSKV